MQPVGCPSDLCNVKVAFEKLADHVLFKCKHSSSILDLEESSQIQVNVPISSFEDNTMKVQPLKFDDRVFFLNEKIVNEYITRFQLQMLGTQEECKKYTVEIKLGDKAGKHVNTFRDHPLPIEMSDGELKSAGGNQISNSFKRKICSPRVSNSKKLAFSIEVTLTAVTD